MGRWRGTSTPSSRLRDEIASIARVVLKFDFHTGVDRYAASVLSALKPEGVFVVTTCNSTADEISALFTVRGFAEKDRVPYPTFEFGGQKGSAIATVAFVGGGA